MNIELFSNSTNVKYVGHIFNMRMVHVLASATHEHATYAHGRASVRLFLRTTLSLKQRLVINNAQILLSCLTLAP